MRAQALSQLGLSSYRRMALQDLREALELCKDPAARTDIAALLRRLERKPQK